MITLNSAQNVLALDVAPLLQEARAGTRTYGKVMTETLKLRDLINQYQTDKDSTYHKLRYATRRSHDNLLSRLASDHGDVMVGEIKGRLLKQWHVGWTNDGEKTSIGHAFVAQLRTLSSFGATMLEEPECDRLSNVLSKMRFPSSKPRTERITSEQATAVRDSAHHFCWPSIALGQAFQFEGTLRQKDVIGEWVPESEPIESDIRGPRGKWIRGIRWEEIDEYYVLRHVTSKKQKPIEIDLKLAPMVMEEFQRYGDHNSTGPVLICDTNGLPWLNTEYRRKWRIVADHAGIPREVKNMDSRAGAISEATDAGIPIEMVKHAAQHSSITMTQRYSRGSAEKVAAVMLGRIEWRTGKEISE